MTCPLHDAAEWLVKIHGNDIAIPHGSALWEDIQAIRLALEAPEQASTAGRTLDVVWAEAVAALPEHGWLTVGTVGPDGLVTIEAMHWPDGEQNRSIARAFKMPMFDAMLSVRDQLRAYEHVTLPPHIVTRDGEWT